MVFKSSLRNILRNPRHLPIYQDVATTVNKIVTASYLFVHYILVNAHDDDEESNADDHMTSTFCCHCKRSVVEHQHLTTQGSIEHSLTVIRRSSVLTIAFDQCKWQAMSQTWKHMLELRCALHISTMPKCWPTSPNIASFKDIISSTHSYNGIIDRLDELEDLGEGFVEAFHFLSPVWNA